MRNTHKTLINLWTVACNLFSVVVLLSLVWFGFDYAMQYADHLIPTFGSNFKAY